MDVPKLAPARMRMRQQRHVIGMLEVRRPEDPRHPMRAAPAVPDAILLDPQHAHATPGKLREGRQPHHAQPQDDDIARAHVPANLATRSDSCQTPLAHSRTTRGNFPRPPV